MHVVQDRQDRRLRCEVPHQRGQSLQKPRQWRLPVRKRAAHDRDAVEQAGEVVKQPPAHGRDLAIRPPLEQRVNGLCPQPERGSHAERVCTAEHARRLRVACQQLPAQPALAHPGLAEQQDDTELPGRRPGELIFQRGHLVAASHQPRPGTWHQPDSGPAAITDQGSVQRSGLPGPRLMLALPSSSAAGGQLAGASGLGSYVYHRKVCAMLDCAARRLSDWPGEGLQMTAGYTPQQSYIASESRQLADADLTPGDQHAGEDHFAHVTGKTCKSCGRPIEAEQAARRRGETEWAHDVCPVVTD